MQGRGLWRCLLLATTVWIAGFLVGCDVSSEPREREPLVKAAIQAVTPTCVTIQSGTNGSVADASISAPKPDKNYDAETLNTGDGGGGERQGLIRFDLGAIPPGATVTSATAQLTVFLGGGDVRVHRATAPWVDSTVTWQSFGGAYLPAVEATLTGGAVYAADLTALAQGWVSGSFANHGILLERDLTSGTTFWSSNHVASIAARPRLDVCYTTDPCAGQPDGSACGDGNPCNGNETCQAGACTAGAPVTCAAQDACHDAGACDPQTGQCNNPQKPDGTSCGGGDLCNGNETCQAGACTAGAPVTCAAQDACHDAGTCDPLTGLCDNPEKPNGTSCASGSLCISDETCQQGACTGTPVTCTAQDACHDAGTCDPLTGLCDNPEKPNGTSCADGNPCNGSETCQAGSCTAGAPVTCAAQDACHDAGTCDPQTGQCSHPPKPDGTSCADGNPCNGSETCQVGSCTAGAPVTCTAQDICHDAGACDPLTGLCDNPPKPNGASCDSGSPCSGYEICQQGACACTPAQATCVAIQLGTNGSAADAGISAVKPDKNYNAETLNTGDGGGGERQGLIRFDLGVVPPGATVTSATMALTLFQGGGDVRVHRVTAPWVDSTVTWQSFGGAYLPAVEATLTGGAVYAADLTALAQGWVDGSVTNHGVLLERDLTASSTFWSSDHVATVAARPRLDVCYTVPFVDPCEGQPDGAPCSDGNACTQTDTCQAGACTGSSPVTCTASDACHTAGTCNPVDGTCSNPTIADGTACDDGNACTQNDACYGGACLSGVDTCCQAIPGFASPPSQGGANVMSAPPELPDVSLMDRDGNRVDDLLDQEAARARAEIAAARDGRALSLARQRLDEPIRVEAIFTSRPGSAEKSLFVREGGSIDYEFRVVSYGFLGKLPRGAVARVAARLGPTLLVLGGDRAAEPHLDEATATGRVRPVWAPNFANNPGGWSGSSTTTIGILDTGLDDSHADLLGRAAYWHDYTWEAHACPVDHSNHGTHVAGIALGTGAAFGVGPGTLRYTDSGSLAGVPPGSYYPSPIHLPQTPVTFTSQATWVGGGTTTLYLLQAPDDTYAFSLLTAPQGAAPLGLSWPFTPQPSMAYTSGLAQSSSGSITDYAIANAVIGYPAVGDGFHAFSGVAPSCKWAGAKVFDQTATGTFFDIEAALDDLVAQRVARNIKILNLSLGATPNGAQVPSARAKVNTAVQNGVVVVVSAGNGGPFMGMSDPARASLVITVGASNDVNHVTAYTSPGFAAPGSDEDAKPDVLAPGGSYYYSSILSADTNDSDAHNAGFADVAHDDYTNISGTSMAAPFVSGSAALVIQALEASGATWSFASASQPLLVKMMLCASATETNGPREAATGGNPTLGRAAAPKDLYEGYGIINPDAAVEALSLVYAGAGLDGATTGGRTDRRAWGRKISFTAGQAWNLSLSMASTADYDLYLYADTPNAKGNPVILASSSTAGLGAVEQISYAPAAAGTGYLFVKRVTGNGSFALMGGEAP